MPKLEIEKIKDKQGKEHYAIVRCFTSYEDQKKHLKVGDQLINTRTGYIRKVEYNCGTFGYTTDDGVAFLYFQYHHVQIVRYLTQKDLQQLCNKNKKKNTSQGR